MSGKFHYIYCIIRLEGRGIPTLITPMKGHGSMDIIAIAVITEFIIVVQNLHVTEVIGLCKLCIDPLDSFVCFQERESGLKAIIYLCVLVSGTFS